MVRKEERDVDAELDTVDVTDGATVVVHEDSCEAEIDAEDVDDTDADGEWLGDGLA